ncbi:MAG: hypothetical protein K6B41_13800 [Butyrivibrio sp.]|nr:hypothetical protein [Butyrivibrio sp.]
MGLVALKKGEVLHRAGSDKVETLEIVIKGSVNVANQFSNIDFGVGGILGIPEVPEKKYSFTYQAQEDSSVYSYPYKSKDDIYKVVKSNPKIANILASTSIKIAKELCDLYDQSFEMVQDYYDELRQNYTDFPMLCVDAGQEPKDFPEVIYITPPEKMKVVEDWQRDYLNSMLEHEAEIKKNVLTISPEIAMGIVMQTVDINLYVKKGIDKLIEYKDDINSTAADFISQFQLVKSRVDEIKRSSGGEDASPVAITNALNTILQYAGASPEITDAFRLNIEEFKKCKSRYDSSDESRKLRRNVALHYYDIYEAAFFRSLEDLNIPPEIMMFLMFGFVDEEIAGADNTAMLYKLMKVYKPDPNGKVVTAYEWLKKIYRLEAEPSRNEFDEDYPTSLRTAKLSGDITAEQVETLMYDPVNRTKFEIKNLLTLGNRMTFGRASSFVPVFDAQNVMKDLQSAYINTETIERILTEIRAVDFTVFCRQSLYSNQEIGVSQLYINEDITPYMILMPNIGSRASLWQEIEGKKRTTPARMLISIFNVENVDDALLKLCGEFRWEMCKTEQGVHWNDVTDPSLTSMYCDYLQFYKKNRALTTDNKEKLRTTLQKYNNNYKNVFVSDYYTYMKFEANSSPRLNKLAREILFTFCPFSAEYREKMSDNPQFGQLISQYKNKVNGAARPLLLTIKKLQKEEIEIPDVLKEQLEYYKK